MILFAEELWGIFFCGHYKIHTRTKHTSYNPSQAIVKSEVLRFQFFFLRKSVPNPLQIPSKSQSKERAKTKEKQRKNGISNEKC